jgi:hypothetical protein
MVSESIRNAAVAGALLTGCTWGMHEDALRARAAFDFQCSADKIALTQLASGSAANLGAVMGAEGCGRRATYVQASLGTWVMNTAEGTPEVSHSTSPSTAPASSGAP